MPDYALKKFLIVEDFQSFRGIMKEMLRGMGAEHIDEATSSREAVSLCEEQQYDVVLADYDLGPGMNGQQLLEFLRYHGLFKRTSIFVMSSAEMNKEQVLTALESEPDAYLAKPFTQGLFTKRLNGICKRHEAMFDIFAAIDREDLEGAISLCEKQIMFDSHYAHFCKRIQADLFYRLKQFDMAEKIYQSVNKERQFDWALLGLGKVQYALASYEQAMVHLQRLLKEFPLNLEGYDEMAKTHMALDESVDAQKVLSRALKISSVSAPRQRFMGEVCWYNEDYEPAIKAFRKAIRLAKHSIHQSPDNGLDLARCLIDFAGENNIEKAAELSKEAFSVLAEVVRDYKTAPVELQGKLVESRGFKVIEKIEDASNSLSEAQRLLKKVGDNVAPEIQLEVAKTFIANDKEDEANEILSELVAKHGNNTALLKKIDKISDEPYSNEGKEKVNDMNKRGAQFYKQKNYLAAINEFSRAETLFPKHVGLKLNLVQALIAELERKGTNEEFEQRCVEGLEQMSHLKPDHKHFERYNSLKNKYTAKLWKANESQAVNQ